MNKQLEQYAELTGRIRALSAPLTHGVDSAEEYHVRLVESFEQIKECARVNEEILRQYFYPLIGPARDLTDEELQVIRDFSAVLVKPESMESLDLPIFYLQTVKMLEDAERKEDLRLRIQALDNLIIAAYAMMMVTLRLAPSFDVWIQYRNKGYRAAEQIAEYLAPSRFKELPDDTCKEAVLINARYIAAFFEWADRQEDKERIDRDIAILERALALCEDPFYREHAPNYNWEYHHFRTLDYLTNLHEFQKYEMFRQDQREVVSRYSGMLAAYLEEHPRYRPDCPKELTDFYIIRNAYIASEVPLSEYKERMRDLFQKRRMDNFDTAWLHYNFMVPYEYLALLDKNNISEEDETLINTFYHEMIAYIFRLPRVGVMSMLLTCLSGVLQNYVETPNTLGMDQMVMRLLAALHAPTYVHSMSVSDFAYYLAEYVMEREPERFVGVLGTGSVKDVMRWRAEILDHVRKGAMLHDAGKLFITETIITYGRRLLMSEFNLIKAHPDAGADLLMKHESTASYAYMARGHHLWYDGTGGYPESFRCANSGEKTVLDILMVADCMDASTDVVGRNYKPGKSLEEFVKELEEGRGTQYAPYLADLFREEGVLREFRVLVDYNREKNYSKAYAILKAYE